VRVAVTGASGFIGSALVPELLARGHEAVAVPRGSFDFGGAEAVIHLAGLAHRTAANAPSVGEFEAVNAELPVTVYREAAKAGVKQMVHVSTIAVLSGNPGELSEDMPLAPTTPYDQAKARAETALLAGTGGPKLTIVRPPLVYGPGAKGHLRRLTWLCSLRVPLPFATVNNQRDMIGVTNLVDVLIFVLRRPGLGIVHATDGVPVSLSNMIATIRQGMMHKEQMFSVPTELLRGLLFNGRMAFQLFGDQRIDAGALRALNWEPRVSPWYDLERMGKAYLGIGASRMSRKL
jgi:UDP-glucose 4-epimerase